MNREIISSQPNSVSHDGERCLVVFKVRKKQQAQI